MDTINKAAIQYLIKTQTEIIERMRERLGKPTRVTGSVPGRLKTEDPETSTDLMANDLYESTLGMLGVPAKLYTEHGEYGSNRPRIYVSSDPIDGTENVPSSNHVYTAGGIYREDGTPIAGAIGDCVNREIVIAGIELKPVRISLDNGTQTRLSRPRLKRKLNGNTRFASYLGRLMYQESYFDRIFPLLKGLGNTSRVETFGGAGAYIGFALNTHDITIMWAREGQTNIEGEPWMEFEPSLALCHFLGVDIIVIDEDGNAETLTFKPEVDRTKRVFALVAGRQPIVQQVVEYIQEILSNEAILQPNQTVAV